MTSSSTTEMKARPDHFNLAILAMGGEGGGVLADWIVDMAEHEGWVAQSTSVPGVAQRTGATIYYIEIHRKPEQADGAPPVLALSPFPGDVDIVIASELMEAGRAVQRGLVTPERTTLITSSHRVFSMTEKTAMGDGRVSSDKLLLSCQAHARQLLIADFSQAAQSANSVISASLFGALAHSQSLPFSDAAFEAAVSRSGIGVATSLKGMQAGRQALRAPVGTPSDTAAAQTDAQHPLVDRSGPVLKPLMQQVLRQWPGPTHTIVLHGIRRLADYQDPAYAADYLQRLAPVAAVDTSAEQNLLRETARHLALWMSYEDTSRVADLKTRKTRFERVDAEVKPGHDTLIDIHEYLHPRLEEVAEVLPARLGHWLLRSRLARGTLGRMVNHSRIVKTNSIRGFLMLYAVASLRGLRRKSLRYQMETAQIGQWLTQITTTAPGNYELAVAIAKAQRLVKGYSDTIARGRQNFSIVMAALPQLSGQPQAAQQFQQLCDAALADDTGQVLQQALRRLQISV
jgi:indolepyruvate ferredoxin oxidoreductase beta subunit